MTVPRSCTCDRFTPGRPYDAARDCSRCWMFAHRPAVRRAWGGDPRDCVPLPVPHPDMPVEELADLLAGPAFTMPEGWRFWPVARAAHLLLAERFLADLPPYPEGQFAGRGAIICGGGRYEASVYVACQMLRHVGWRHPIQVWHRGAAEPLSARVRQLPGVEVVDAEAHPARPSRRILAGWAIKTFALVHCPFEEVLFLDADCYPICDPDECFEPAHNPHGIVTWPDLEHTDPAVHWPTYDLPPNPEPGLNGGHYVFTKRKAWPVLRLAGHYDDHSDYYYWWTTDNVQVGGFSDQEQLRAALHKLGARHHRYTRRPLACVSGSYIQAGPGGRTLFVHRHHTKYAPPGAFFPPPQWSPEDLPMEAIAWRFFLDWLTEPIWDGIFPDEVPGWFTRNDGILWARVCQDRAVLELGRYHGRSTVVTALSARKVVSLDRASAGEADLWLQRYGVRHKVWLREGSFAALVPTSGGPFSAAFIDGDHDRRNVEADIETVLPHLAPGAVLGFHDYDDPLHPDVRPVVDAAAARFGWRFLERADFLAVFLVPATPP